MALTKAKKAIQIDQLAHELEGSTSAIVGTFAKLTVSQDFELRKVVRGAGGRYRVLKNKLAARASKGTKVEKALQGLKGVSSVAYTSGDPVSLAKALSTWMVENAEYTFKLGIIDGQLISVEEVKQLATMPSKEQIFSKLLFLISAPAQRLVTVMNAAGRDLAVVINQGVEKGKFAAPAAAAVEAPPAPEAKVAVAEPEATPAPEAKVETAAAVAEPETAPVPEAKVETAPAVAEPEAPSAPEAKVETAVVEPEAPVTISKDAEAAGTSEDSQAAAAATEPPVEG